MPAAIFNLTGDYVIEQNAGWKAVLFYPGDVRSAKFRGQVKTGYDGKLLADFSFGSCSFNPAENVTAIPMELSSDQTRRLPVPSPTDTWVYDVLMRLPGSEPIRLVQGTATMTRGVTVNV